MSNGLPVRRNRLRYPGYDYAQAGAAFVTICLHNRQSLLGEVSGGVMQPSEFGQAVSAAWERIPTKYPEIAIDSFVVMPDHVHAVLLTGVDPALNRKAATVGDAVRWFKNVTIRGYRDGVVTRGWVPYEQHLWQDKFHDHIIRSAQEMTVVRAYIGRNPER